MKKVLIIAAAILAMTACRQNPLLSEWDTPYGIPPFESIKISDYKPAIKAGIAQQEKEIAEIKACAEAPSFENTIAALDRSGEILARFEHLRRVGVDFHFRDLRQSLGRVHISRGAGGGAEAEGI